VNLEQVVQQYEQELIKDLQSLIGIPSVRDMSTAGPGAPFGKEIRVVLEWYLDRAKEMGFTVKNVDGYAGHVEYGEGEELLGVLAHLDVVPPGEGWKYPVFGGEIAEGKIYGRGVVDNKGPAILALYALKAMKDNGVVPNKRIRVIVGCDEESGMECVKYYFQHEEKPTLGFSPDADFPLIHAEKGILQMKALWKGEDVGLCLSGGERPNVVPPKAEAYLTGDRKQPQGQDQISIESTPDGTKVIASGLASHASVPHKGDNAIVRLLNALEGSEVGEHAEKLKFIANIGLGLNGEGLDIELVDDVSGKLTCNLGMIKFAEGRGEAVIDVRSPVTFPLEQTLERARARLQAAGFEVEVLTFDQPHHVPKDSALVQALLKVYREHTGDQGDAYAIGGGTYARKLAGAVAFGPMLPGRDDVAHIANEYLALEDLRVCLKIYTGAILELVNN
jgi:succinyl-diaminopimelate desuccinylase